MLSDLNFKILGRGINFSGNDVLHPIFLCANYTKLCPSCITDEAYIKKIWNVLTYTCCTIHQRVLIDKCLKCNRKISSLRSIINICKGCGFDFREDIKCRVLFLISNYIPESKQFKCFRGKVFSNAELHVVLQKSFFVFENWPYNYFEYLSAIKGTNNLSVLEDFQLFYYQLYRKFIEPQYKFLKSAFRKYLQNNLENCMSGESAATLLKIDTNTLKRLIDIGKIEGYIKRTNSLNRVFVVRESVNEFKRIVDNNLNMRELCKLIGCDLRVGKRTSPALILKLIDEGYITPIYSPKLLGVRIWLFDAIEVHRFIEKISFHLRNLNDDENIDSLISFRDVINKQVNYGLDMISIVKLIINGSIIPYSKQDKSNKVSNSVSTLFGVSSRKITNMLLSNGIEAVSGPFLNERGTYLFMKNDSMNMLLNIFNGLKNKN